MTESLAVHLVLLVGLAAGSACQGSTQISVVDRPACTGGKAHYPTNRAPLLPSVMMRLPLGEVRAEGWLRRQLELMADGQVGHLEELSRFLGPESGWLGGQERGWEEAAYWLRGFYDLARLTDDPRLLAVARRWIEAVIASQQPDGYYGSRYNRLVEGRNGRKIVDLWPQMVMNDALISHCEATGDERIVPLLLRFFAFCRDLPDEQFLPPASWEIYEHYREYFGDWKPRIQLKRAGDFVPQLIWLYNRTGEKWLLDLAVKVYHRTLPPMNHWLDDHAVHFAQRFRYPAQMYPLTGDPRYLRTTELFYDGFVSAFGQMPRGVYAADERIRPGKIDPRQAIETCALVELNKSHYILGRITGSTRYADRVEDITFNHLPASHAPDHRSLRYLTACNMAYSVPRMDFTNQGLHAVFAADLHRCCQHNASMGWPRFVRNLWQATPDGGLLAWLYSPSTVTAKVGESGRRVKIVCKTNYPFDETILMTVHAEVPVAFPLYLRIPGWSRQVDLRVVGPGGISRQIAGQAGRLIKLERLWREGDRVELRLGMSVSATVWARTGAVTVNRGPLSYSVRIKQRWQREPGGPEDWPRWSVWPESAWNYGLALDPGNPAEKIEIEKTETLAAQPWCEAHAPVVLRVPARRIPGWGAGIQHTVDPVREGPVRSDEPVELVEMIPLGCAHLRISVLPVVSHRPDARRWEEIPDPTEFMFNPFDRQ